ncbi:Transposase [Shigella dysenteriae 1617]|uniref:Transposase n=1 Tax=Shigella dysenteriae 1617 TaxID=754093 RepID=A0A0A7A341_SHIDY|nr:Transposase [Shigella dysenteriae 1617]
MAVTAAKSVMAFRVLTMAVDLCRLTTRTMNVNAGHERTSKARIIHQIQLIRGITPLNLIIRDILLSSGIRKKRENKRLTYRTVKNATILRFENDDTITVGAFINDRV